PIAWLIVRPDGRVSVARGYPACSAPQHRFRWSWLARLSVPPRSAISYHAPEQVTKARGAGLNQGGLGAREPGGSAACAANRAASARRASMALSAARLHART